MNINEINSGTLAFLGDSVYEINIRYYLVTKFNKKPNELKEKSIKYVSAKSQELILESLLEKNILNKHEIDIVMRARNYTPKSKPKNASIITYKKATALEALFGMLYIENNHLRIDELIKEIVGE